MRKGVEVAEAFYYCTACSNSGWQRMHGSGKKKRRTNQKCQAKK